MTGGLTFRETGTASVGAEIKKGVFDTWTAAGVKNPEVTTTEQKVGSAFFFAFSTGAITTFIARMVAFNFLILFAKAWAGDSLFCDFFAFSLADWPPEGGPHTSKICKRRSCRGQDRGPLQCRLTASRTNSTAYTTNGARRRASRNASGGWRTGERLSIKGRTSRTGSLSPLLR